MEGKKILITGTNGQLANSFISIIGERKMEFFAPREEEFDITNFINVKATIDNLKPDIIINCASYNRVEEAETQQELAYKVNSTALEHLSSLCKKKGIFFVHYSTDYVFDGEKQDFYTESDKPNPINVYGKSKLKGEEIIRGTLDDYLIFRVSWVFGKGKNNFLFKVFEWVKKNRVVKISADEVSVPTYTEDIVNVTLLALEKGLVGLYHLTNSGYASRYEFAKYFINKMEWENIVIPLPLSSFHLSVRRPLFSAMSNEKLSKDLGVHIPTWENAIERFVLNYEF
ncbi:MAG: dTDP-4-dehydrorhamnose reductase [Candidatus Omnitrophica bacterium]|nr:dTDP-4-dehydrorhamnose reductase [Candidatus Omnitrophota bacterium]